MRDFEKDGNQRYYDERRPLGKWRKTKGNIRLKHKLRGKKVVYMSETTIVGIGI